MQSTREAGKHWYNSRVKSSDEDELALIQRVAHGDQQAFLALYDRYAARVNALTLRILSDPMLAEEATQDTFVKVMELRPAIPVGARFVYRLAAHHRPAHGP